ncbi:succinate dehydrogenase [Thalassobaculum sp.]|uniref:succinate dehydrogenase n=1 Tax=Thalassobaculum sp. TaxID=2022740 RepID=UPI0032EE19E9
MTPVVLYLAQRLTALILAPLVIAHLVLILIAVEGGLTAAEILARTRGSVGWALFYGLFVAAAAVHAPIGLRNVIHEHTRWTGRSLDWSMLALAVLLAGLGARAVLAVVVTP